MKKLLTYVLFSFIINCASSEKIISDYDDTVNFDTYSTFVMCLDDLSVENFDYPKYDNDNIRSMLGDAVEAQMLKIGYKTNVLDPELQAGFKLIVEEVESTFKNCELDDDIKYWHECTINTEVYSTETLIVYVSDFKMNQIIWQASIACDMKKSNSNIVPYINTLVEKLFNKYPNSY